MIDLHCHLDLYNDPHAVVAECRKAGTYVLSVTTTPKAWRGTLALAKGASRIRTALGLHPQIAHERLSELALFEGLLPETRYVGEIGLDGTPEHRVHWREQQQAFIAILSMTARSGGKILSIHSRRATDEVLEALEASPGSGLPILHWFSGTKSQLRRAISMGCWFSVGPAMLRGRTGQDLAREMPRDRVLTETDGPFGTINGRPLVPADADIAVRELATIWGEPQVETRARLRNTLKRLSESAASDKIA